MIPNETTETNRSKKWYWGVPLLDPELIVSSCMDWVKALIYHVQNTRFDPKYHTQTHGEPEKGREE